MDTTATSTSIDVSTYDHQLQCPLFGTLPGEIRNEIFALALVQYEEEGPSAYPVDSYWYRPGFTGPRRSSCSLLRACKLAYAEGQQVFLRELEWAFWFDRGPKGRTKNAACKRFFGALTEQQSRDLTRVRFFTQMYWLEGGWNLGTLFRQPRFRPEVLTITVRYSDWWYWETDEPLRMSENWLRVFQGPRGLRELRVEYETLVGKRGEMMRIVERNKGWKLAVGGLLTSGRRVERVVGEDGVGQGEEGEEEEGYLSAEGTALVEWRWKGPSKLGGKAWAHHGEGETVEYVVVMDTWRFVEGPMSEEDRMRRADGGDGHLGGPGDDDEVFDSEAGEWPEFDSEEEFEEEEEDDEEEEDEEEDEEEQEEAEEEEEEYDEEEEEEEEVEYYEEEEDNMEAMERLLASLGAQSQSLGEAAVF
ncbi:hypothetical protein CORC01_08915 [Colletotrichum orchidophilum]|uniref:Uncharacterized protein n=1 Tax=Colletotrichum orchidophilum TaxID=1209926 RepID=A0A1G4B304_9PEZI|nr:uncharacterized protein CORC01_08915 [Colletotrichum orchidophilum]OHE95774.1 hypothetical protein CORC01_08915 [Colletotrichum orchidophilum]